MRLLIRYLTWLKLIKIYTFDSIEDAYTGPLLFFYLVIFTPYIMRIYVSSVVRAVERQGHGFESHTCILFFFSQNLHILLCKGGFANEHDQGKVVRNQTR